MTNPIVSTYQSDLNTTWFSGSTLSQQSCSANDIDNASYGVLGASTGDLMSTRMNKH